MIRSNRLIHQFQINHSIQSNKIWIRILIGPIWLITLIQIINWLNQHSDKSISIHKKNEIILSIYRSLIGSINRITQINSGGSVGGIDGDECFIDYTHKDVECYTGGTTVWLKIFLYGELNINRKIFQKKIILIYTFWNIIFLKILLGISFSRLTNHKPSGNVGNSARIVAPVRVRCGDRMESVSYMRPLVRIAWELLILTGFASEN